MHKNKTTNCTSCLSIFSLIILFIFLNGEQLFAQEKNEIDEKRKTIINIKDTLVKLSSHVYAILSDGEAGNIAIYENPDGLVLVDDQWVELLPKIKKLLATISNRPVKYVLNTHFHYDHSDGNKIQTRIKKNKMTAIETLTTQQVAERFNELAQQEKWFEIQEELFADIVKSIDPSNSPYFKNAEGKDNVRKKGEDFVKRIEAAHKRHSTEPIIAGNHFAVGRQVDITVQGFGRIQINQIMLYEVKDGEIISEQFFY
jgi:hypothetical protein